jgi:hypothetical protein
MEAKTMTQDQGNSSDQLPKLNIMQFRAVRVLDTKEVKKSNFRGQELQDALMFELLKSYSDQAKLLSTMSKAEALSKVEAVWNFEKLVGDLEKRAELEKRSRKFMPKDPTEPRITYWLSAPIAYMLSEEQREEWLGDLQEVNREMMRKGYPEWMISIVNVGQIIRLIVSSLDIKIVDLILKLRGKA